MAQAPPEFAALMSARRPLNIYRMLPHAGPAGQGFLKLGGALLRENALDAQLREVAILRVGHLSKASYEVHQHRRGLEVGAELGDGVRLHAYDRGHGAGARGHGLLHGLAADTAQANGVLQIGFCPHRSKRGDRKAAIAQERLLTDPVLRDLERAAVRPHDRVRFGRCCRRRGHVLELERDDVDVAGKGAEGVEVLVLGHDFDVVKPIIITKLGIFDSGSNGISATLTAQLYARNNGGTPTETTARH